MGNRIKTTVLLSLLTLLLLAVGYFLVGQEGMAIGFTLSFVMHAALYRYSDRIILSLYRAQELQYDQAPSLHDMVRDLAARAGIPPPRLYLVRLPLPNAFATGRNEYHAAIAIRRSLLHLLHEEELRGVLAHEIAHIKNRDILLSTLAATIAGALTYAAHITYIIGIMGDRREEGGSLMLLLLSPIVATLLHLAISRSREFLADETGARLSGNPKALARALRTMHSYSSRNTRLMPRAAHMMTAHLFILYPFHTSSLSTLLSSHPSIPERVKRLQNLS